MNFRYFSLIVIFSYILQNCSTLESSFNNDDWLNQLQVEKTHLQNLNLEVLKAKFSDKNTTTNTKFFLAYYILRNIDSPILVEYVKSNISILNEDTCTYCLLYRLNFIEENNIDSINSILNKTEKTSPNNLYLLIEKYNIDTNLNNKLKAINVASKLYPESDIVATLNIIENTYNNDSVGYNKNLTILKKKFDNYYTNLFIANEYAISQQKDSAIFYCKKSLKNKENIGAYLLLSQLYSRYGNESFASINLNKAEKIDKLDVDVLTLKAWSFFDKKNYTEAENYFKELIKYHPKVESYKEFLLYYLFRNNNMEARKIYNNFIQQKISKEERAGYFLVFASLEASLSKNIDKYYNSLDSIKISDGLLPIKYSNKIIEKIIEQRAK